MDVEKFAQTYGVTIDEANRLSYQINNKYELRVCYDDKTGYFYGAILNKNNQMIVCKTFQPFANVEAAIKGVNAFAERYQLKPKSAQVCGVHANVSALLYPVKLLSDGMPGYVGRHCNPPVIYQQLLREKDK